MSRISTTSPIARAMQHTASTHNSHYSSEIVEVNEDGAIIRPPMIIARDIHAALGECQFPLQSQRLDHVELDRSDFDSAARRCYQNPTASVTNLQFLLLQHICGKETRSAVVHAGCGTGKSGAYILSLMSQEMYHIKKSKMIVISPHNSLLSQHKMQASRYFSGTSLSVGSLLPSDIAGISESRIPTDLTFVSIHAFKLLVSDHAQILENSGVTHCFIDEVHNLFQELFRHGSSWCALRGLARMNWRIYCLSATVNSNISNCVGSYLGLRESLDLIGSGTKYHVPNVAIRITNTTDSAVITDVVNYVVSRVRSAGSGRKIHVITATRDDAVSISNKLKESSISAMWLTSDATQQERLTIMQDWSESSDPAVLSSTFSDGIDCSLTEEVVVVRNGGSISRFIQAAGRVRPPKQVGAGSVVRLFRTSYDPTTEGDISSAVSFITAERMVPEGVSAESMFRQHFTLQGLNSILDGDTCLRKSLLSAIGVQSVDCGMCEACLSSNTLARDTANAISVREQHRLDEDYVVSTLNKISSNCLACGSTQCDGFKCLNTQLNSCLKCHGPYHDGGYNNCLAKTVQLQSGLCPYCLVRICDKFPCPHEEHNRPGGCKFKDRIRCILLYDLRKVCDKGKSAKERIENCARSEWQWFEVMAKNIRTIESELEAADFTL